MTDVKLNDLLSSLSNNTSILNSHSDSCNKKLKDIQDRLVSLNIGLEYWLKDPISRSDQRGKIGPNDISTEVVKRLGFTRLNGSWVLAVKTIRCDSGFYEGEMDCPYTNEYVDKEPEPLLDVSRELRLSAAAAIPDFLSGYNDLVQQVNAKLA